MREEVLDDVFADRVVCECCIEKRDIGGGAVECDEGAALFRLEVVILMQNQHWRFGLLIIVIISTDFCGKIVRGGESEDCREENGERGFTGTSWAGNGDRERLLLCFKMVRCRVQE